ncbi:MAG: sensor domain-containing diguanylate cyclase, partial [Deltaproteobacteria bacterium]|nr:sensor domain-containing diguanylate cyclase [Deltaproteobacteria bacterium]
LRLDRHRRVLRRLLDLGVAVSRLASVEVIFTEALEGVAALLGASSSTGFVATENHGVLVTRGADERVALRATRGRFEPVQRCSLLPQPVREVVGVALASTRPRLEDGFVVVPLATSDGERGCIVVESPCLPEEAVEPLGIYARHVTQALENAVLFERATVDPLTELFNRRFGLHRLDETLRLGARAGTPTAVLLLDLDHFKRVNDEHGHAAGDVVLRTVAETVRRTLRSTDVVARYGGEELFAVLPCTGALQALEAAERVRSAVEAVRVAFEGRSLRVTTSIGAAAGAPGVADGGALLREADRALYAAKQGGRNRVGAADAHARMAS